MSTRRITTGKVGRQLLGSVIVQDNSLKSVIVNENLVLDPNGTGIVVSESSVQVSRGNNLNLGDASGAGGATQYSIGLKAPNTGMTANQTYTFPSAAVDGRFLKCDSNGNLSWDLAAVSVTNQASDSSTYYPAITTNTSGTLTAVSVSSTKMTFQPSTGRFSSTELRATGNTASSSTTTGALVVTGGLGVGGQLTVNNSSVTSSTASSSVSTGALVVTGGVGIGGQLTVNNIVETSSIVFKENIEYIQNPLETLAQLVGVKYTRKSDEEENIEYGLIAEDVYRIIPEAVSLDDKGNPYGIKYTRLIAHMIESIKRLKNEVETLKG